MKRPREAGPRGRFGQYAACQINLAQPFWLPSCQRVAFTAGRAAESGPGAAVACTPEPIQVAAATMSARIACQTKDLERAIGRRSMRRCSWQKPLWAGLSP